MVFFHWLEKTLLFLKKKRLKKKKRERKKRIQVNNYCFKFLHTITTFSSATASACEWVRERESLHLLLKWPSRFLPHFPLMKWNEPFLHISHLQPPNILFSHAFPNPLLHFQFVFFPKICFFFFWDLLILHYNFTFCSSFSGLLYVSPETFSISLKSIILHCSFIFSHYNLWIYCLLFTPYNPHFPQLSHTSQLDCWRNLCINLICIVFCAWFLIWQIFTAFA